MWHSLYNYAHIWVLKKGANLWDLCVKTHKKCVLNIDSSCGLDVESFIGMTRKLWKKFETQTLYYGYVWISKKYAHMETYSSANEQHRQVVIFGPNAWSLAVDYTDKLSELLGCEYADWYEYVTPNWLMYEPEVLSTNWNVRNWQLREVYLIPPLVFSMDLHDLEEWPLRTSKNRYSVINRNTFTPASSKVLK